MFPKHYRKYLGKLVHKSTTGSVEQLKWTERKSVLEDKQIDVISFVVTNLNSQTNAVTNELMQCFCYNG